MPDQPEYSEASEVFQRSMRDALAHLDKLSAEVLKAKEDAIDQEIRAKDELLRIQRDAEKHFEEFTTQHRKAYDERVRSDTIKDVVEKLIRAGRSSVEIKAWLEVSDEVLKHAHKYLGYEPLEDRPATVMYETKGRAGNVYFNWDGLIIVFAYEFAGGNSLATIDVPNADQWEAQTTLPKEKRDLVLEFISKRIVRDQAPNHQFEIKDTFIRIYP